MPDILKFIMVYKNYAIRDIFEIAFSSKNMFIQLQNVKKYIFNNTRYMNNMLVF